jgi:hypothetical protein
MDAQRKPIAAIITEYWRNSHADVVVGRLLDGYAYGGEWRAPRVEVVSMYTDKVPANDLSRAQAARHGFRIFPTVAAALTLGGPRLAVEGVVLIGEHGDYPDNEQGQKLYPRWELFQQIVDTFRSTGQAVPVFCDKHLSYAWDKAKAMVDAARELRFPLLAGSSLPLAWRRPELELGLGLPVEHAVATFYGGKESYGFHVLESLQCMVERRRGGETGIAAVECLEGGRVWEWTDAHPWASRLLGHCLQRSSGCKPGSPRANALEPLLFVLEYRSGLQAAAYLLSGHVETTGFAAAVAGQEEPLSTEIWLQPGRPFGHFSGLAHAIEQMMLTGRPAYPVERTLLTTGALAALMDSSYRKCRLETPHLSVAYQAPEESLYNRGPVPPAEAEPW